MRGEFELVYVTPERLVTPAMLDSLRDLHREVGIVALVVDEAHLVSAHGFDFRPDLMLVGKVLAPAFPAPSATHLHPSL